MAINTFSGGNPINSLQAAAKNYAINGGADIWQRGTTFTNAVAYTADRWYQAASNVTTTQETTIVPTGFRYSVKGTTTATTQPYWMQAIETSNAILLAGQTVTLSYYAATSNSSNVLIRLDYSTNVDEAIAGTYTTIASNSVAATSTMSRVSATFAVPSTAKTLRILVGAAGSQTTGVTTSFTGVQLELGTTATTFSRAGGTIQGELAACQRYYYRSSSTGTYGVINGYGYAVNTSAAQYSVYLPVQMRILPAAVEFSAITLQDNLDNVIASITTITLSSVTSSTLCGNMTVNSSALFTTGRTYRMLQNNNAAGYIGFSAEL